MGSTHGVKASSSPNRKKPPSTSAKLPSKRRAISMSLAKIESCGRSSTPAAASCMEALDSIGT
jgi:hypothetical protein